MTEAATPATTEPTIETDTETTTEAPVVVPPVDMTSPEGVPSALETLAKAGDENARRLLGQPTAGGGLNSTLVATARAKGWIIGEQAPKDVYVDQAGKVGKPGKDGFSGTQAAAKGADVTALTLLNLASAGFF